MQGRPQSALELYIPMKKTTDLPQNYKSDFYCKGNAVLINYVESMKDSVVVGLRCLLFCRKLVKRENIVTENLIKNHNMF